MDRPEDDADNIAWVRSAFESLQPFGNGSVYLNFTGRADEPPSAGVDSAFGRNLQRLAEVKKVYDPTTSSAATTTSHRLADWAGAEL